jgi:hypothetical protein
MFNLIIWSAGLKVVQGDDYKHWVVKSVIPVLAFDIKIVVDVKS